MRWFLALCLLLAAGVADAQTPLTGTTGAPTTAPSPATMAPATASPAARRTLAERFAAANTTHDGHLTAEQARSGMPAVSRQFAQIDAGHKGYVTLDDIKAFNKARRAARKAAKGQ